MAERSRERVLSGEERKREKTKGESESCNVNLELLDYYLIYTLRVNFDLVNRYFS